MHKQLSLSLKIFTCATLLVIQATQPSLASEFSAAGCAAFARNKQWKPLAEYTQRWTKAQPDSADAWYALGNAYGSSEHKFGMQQPEKAAEAYKRAVLLQPKMAKAWNALGHASFESGNRDDSLNAFKKAVQLEPNNPRYLNSLGSINAMGHNPNDAAATSAYQRAIGLGSKDAQRNNAIIHRPITVTTNGWNSGVPNRGYRQDPYFLHVNPVTGSPLLDPSTGKRLFPY